MSPNSGGRTTLKLALGLLFVLQAFAISEHKQHECARTCVVGEPSKMCRFVFNLELDTTLSRSACASCSGNVTTCSEPRCVTANGVKRSFLSINKQLPGPTIEVCQNDSLEVEVRNRLPGGAEVALHWHGQTQRGTPHMDGVPMVTQCPVPPGASFTYRFTARDQGTHFYHAHFVTQQWDGIYGALIVNTPSSQSEHSTAHTLLVAPWTNAIQSGAYGALNGDLEGPAKPAALLVNGRGAVQSALGLSSQLAQFTLLSGELNLLRIINAAAIDCPVRLSLQNHVLRVRRIAGAEVRPVTISSLVIFPGERLDVEVRADQDPGEHALLLQGLNTCANTPTQQALVKYATLDQSSANISPQSADYNVLTSDCSAAENSQDKLALCSVDLEAQDIPQLTDHDLSFTLPFGRTHVSAVTEKDLEFRFILEDVAYYPTFLHTKSSSALVPHLNHVTFRYPASPVLIHPEDDEVAAKLSCETLASSEETPASRPHPSCRAAPHYCECTHILRVPLNATVQITLAHSVVADAEDNAQTVHLHGNLFYVTKWRTASGEWRDVKRPALRDTVTVPRAGAVIILFRADNPGFWLLEARAGHVTSAGVGAAALLQVGDREQIAPVPSNFPRCSGHRPEDLIF